MSGPEEHRAYRNKPFEPEVELAGFSHAESVLLMKYGAWLEALMDGVISPYTDEQRHFVDMCHGRVAPSTPHEVVWRKYRIEVLYHHAIQMDERAGVYSYAEIRDAFMRLARMGHEKSQAWLSKEGEWKDAASEPQSSYVNPIYASIFPMFSNYGGGGEQDSQAVKNWKLRKFMHKMRDD